MKLYVLPIFPPKMLVGLNRSFTDNLILLCCCNKISSSSFAQVFSSVGSSPIIFLCPLIGFIVFVGLITIMSSYLALIGDVWIYQLTLSGLRFGVSFGCMQVFWFRFKSRLSSAYGLYHSNHIFLLVTFILYQVLMIISFMLVFLDRI